MIDYDNFLTSEEKRKILSQNIEKFVVEAYYHRLNKLVGESTEQQELIDNSEKNIELLEKALEVYLNEYQLLTPEDNS